MTEFTFDYDSFSDLYKDTYGFRPRGHRFYDPETTDAERQEIWDFMIVEHTAEMDRLEEYEKESERKFEEAIQTVMETGAGDRETAIRWLIEAECDEYDLMYGFSLISYNFGISYKYRDEVQAVIDKILASYEVEAA